MSALIAVPHKQKCNRH